MKSLIRRVLNTEIGSPRADLGILVYRILLSLSLINTHGMKKLLDIQGTIEHIPDPLGLGGVFNTAMALLSNIVCPIFIILGLGTRLAILPVVGTTLLGFFVV
ncbi:MAG TPA: DoxX family protein, partial [Cytophagales bacterium]|nr:DoxX family protein [Cytophagales bacterium]